MDSQFKDLQRGLNEAIDFAKGNGKAEVTTESFEGMPNIVVWYHKIWLPTVKEIEADYGEPKLPTLKEIESMYTKEIEELIDNYKSQISERD